MHVKYKNECPMTFVDLPDGAVFSLQSDTSAKPAIYLKVSGVYIDNPGYDDDDYTEVNAINLQDTDDLRNFLFDQPVFCYPDALLLLEKEK